MGGHGGLNILPQNRWNVYNFENREKVRRLLPARSSLSAKLSRRRDAEFRLDRLRRIRGIHQKQSSSSEGDFTSLRSAQVQDANRYRKRSGNVAKVSGSKRSEKRKREDAPAPVAPEDEKYKLGYGDAENGVKAPWYLPRPSALSEDVGGEVGVSPTASASVKKNAGKKTIEELREERMRREKKEKEKEHALLAASRKESDWASQGVSTDRCVIRIPVMISGNGSTNAGSLQH